MEDNKMLEEFYNYKDWRTEQRKQLTINSNIFFTFNVASIGYVINYLIQNGVECQILKRLFLSALFFFVMSIILYVTFNLIRLSDYRKTAKLIDNGTLYDRIRAETSCLGKAIWNLFYIQIALSVLGLFLTLFTFYQILF